jgi:hypothetical protein
MAFVIPHEVAVGKGVSVGVLVGVLVGTSAVFVAVLLGVLVGTIAVFVGVLLGVFVGTSAVFVAVLLGVFVGTTAVLVGVLLGVWVGTTAVLVGVLLGVEVGTRAVFVGVLLGVAVILPHALPKDTSSTYMLVQSPKLSPCTRNSMRTVCPAYGVISKVWLVHVWVLEHTCMMVASMVPLVSVTYASCQSKLIESVVSGLYQ